MTKQDIKDMFGIIGALIGATVLVGTLGFMMYAFVMWTQGVVL